MPLTNFKPPKTAVPLGTQLGKTMGNSPEIAITNAGSSGFSGIPSQEYSLKLKGMEADVANKLAQKKSITKSLADKIGSTNQEAILAATTVPGLLDRAKELRNVIPESPIFAGSQAIASKTPFVEAWIGKDYQPVISNNGLLTQTLTKMYQGSRPSDYDQKVNQQMVDASGKGRETYDAALNEVERHFKSRKLDLFNNLAALYGEVLTQDEVRSLGDTLNIPTKKVNLTINNLFSPNKKWRYIPDEGTQPATPTKNVITLPDGTKFTILGK